MAVTLTISNLDHAVTEEDLRSLVFDLLYDDELANYHLNNTSTTNTAQITFKYAKDAKAFLQAYHGVLLDGKAMKITTSKK